MTLLASVTTDAAGLLVCCSDAGEEESMAAAAVPPHNAEIEKTAARRAIAFIFLEDVGGIRWPAAVLVGLLLSSRARFSTVCSALCSRAGGDV